MEGGNAKYLFEWSYENFSCWNSEIHGKNLFYKYNHTNLYPRGRNGDGENLAVNVWDQRDSSIVELSFIGSDGSLVCKQERQNLKWDKHYLNLPPGPKFDEIVQTRKNKDLQKDILTLQLHRSDNSYQAHGRTISDVEDICLRIPVFKFNGMQLENYTWISTFSFNNGNKTYNFNLNARLVGATVEVAKLFFELIPDFVKSVLIHTDISLLDRHGVVVESEENKHIFRDKEKWTFSGILQRNELMENHSYLTLLVKFISGDIQDVDSLLSIEYIDRLATKPIIPSKNSTENVTEDHTVVPPASAVDTVSSDSSISVLLQQLMCLHQDQDFSDFQLKCGDVSFPVHKNILSARSPVFKTMLSTDIKKAAANSVDIEDLDSSTLARFLAFLYTGAVEELQGESALKLYYAADKYQVPTLKRECADFLCSNVSISNVCAILSLVDKHHDDKLTSVVHNFILKNYNAVLISEEWKDLMMKEPLLCAKTLTHFAEQNRMKEINTW